MLLSKESFSGEPQTALSPGIYLLTIFTALSGLLVYLWDPCKRAIEQMKLTYFGHSCFLLETGGSALLFDPFLSQNPLAKTVDWKAIKPDFVLVSHAHYDHILDAEFFLKEHKSTLISNFEIGNWMLKKGEYQVIKMNLGARIQCPFGEVRMTASYHSSTLPDGSPGGNPGGFVIESQGSRLYFAGDTGLGPYLDFVGQHWSPDVALLPISGRVTLDAEDAVLAAQLLKCQHVVGMHFDAFPELSIDKDKTKAIFDQAKIQLSLLNVGQTIQW